MVTAQFEGYENPVTVALDTDKELLTTREVAARLGVHQSRVLQLIRDERFKKAFKKGAIWLIPQDDVSAVANTLRRVGRPRVIGTRVRTDRINDQIVPPDLEPLTGVERYNVQSLVAERISTAAAPLDADEMINIGLDELAHKHWPPALSRRVVAMILFGRLPSEV